MKAEVGEARRVAPWLVGVEQRALGVQAGICSTPINLGWPEMEMEASMWRGE